MLSLAALAATFTAASVADSSHLLKGTVLDADSQSPVAGAVVQVRGAALRTQTDAQGKFQLDLGKPCQTVEVAHPGFKSWKKRLCAGERTLTLHRAATTAPAEEAESKVMDMAISPQSTLMEARAYAPAAKMGQALAYEAPPNFNTEDYALIQENRFYAARSNPLSTFSIDVDAASYSNLRRFINNGQTPPKDAVRIEEMVNYFRYNYPEPEGAHPFSVTTELSACPWAAEHKLLHIGLQGASIEREDLPPSNLVFLLDVSGSMNAPNKLPLLKSSFKLLVDQMRPQDRVAIVVYAGAAGVVLEPTAGDNQQKIKDALEQLQAGGSTAGGQGLRLAYQLARKHFAKEGNNRVILATDGDFNVGESSDAAMVRLIEKERESGIFLTVLGFGTGNYKDNKMQQLAQHGNGNNAYIDNINEARKVLVEEYGGTVFAIAKDVKLQLEFNPAMVQGYRLIGYENRLLDDEDFKDDTKDAGELGAGHTVTALYEIIPAGVETDLLASVDPLKYQTREPNEKPSREWCTLKLRYKAPESGQSQLLTHFVEQEKPAPSPDFNWSAVVAGFGMLLRDSDYKGTSNYPELIRLAKSAKGVDEHGYRQELIRMMETMHALSDPLEADTD